MLNDMLASLFGVLIMSGSSVEPIQLRCESLTDPVGIGTAFPKLSWKVGATAGGQNLSQTAYRILVATDPKSLSETKADLWDSGVIRSDETIGVTYKGKPLGSNERCWWRVQIVDQDGYVSQWSPPARFGIGLLKESDWKADWIGFDEPRNALKTNDPFEGAKWIWGASGVKIVEFRKVFSVDRVPLKAKLNITADDHFVVTLNNAEVHRSSRETDSWRKPVEIDISKSVVRGENQIRVQVEDTGGDAGLLAVLNIENATADPIAIRTNSEWTAAPTKDGPFRAAREVATYGANPWGRINQALVLPSPRLLRNEFTLSKPIKSATLHGTALGIFEMHLNGQKVGSDYFMPGWSDYAKRTYACSYDVTKQLWQGENAIGIVLGDGWFSGYVGYGGRRDHYGTKLRAKAQIVVNYADGTTETIGTSKDWKASTGPIIFSDFLMGETYNATNELKEWDQPNFRKPAHFVKVGTFTLWKPVDVGNDFQTTIEPFPGQPVREIAVLQAKTITQPKPGVYVLNLGQNIAGFARLKLKGRRGQEIVLRFAERLSPDGNIYTVNLRGAKATDTYICRGEGTETWSPSFTFHGFQYVEVTGLGRRPTKDEVVGVAVSSDTPNAGTIETSDPMINRLVKNAWWTQAMNFIDIPTDCPQRDERLGWTGDAQAYIRTATYLNDVQPFFTKWLVALDDSQREDGQFPMVAPVKVAGSDGGPAWADAGVICPWTIYDVYGDRQLLERHYPSMKRFVEFCRKRSTPDLLPPKEFHAFGDWVNINDPTPNEVIYEAYFAGSARILSQAAYALGKVEDGLEYETLYRRVRRAFQGAYTTPDGKVSGDSQCAYVLALGFDLLEKDMAAKAASHLVARIESKGWHLSTGFVGTRDIMHVLSKIGRNDVAFRLLHNKTFPRWGFTIENGATSIWERWDGWTPDKGFQDPGMNSFAHYAFGAVVGWIFAQPAGITNLDPGFKTVKIAPQIDPNLKWLRSSYESVRGTIVSEWRKNGTALTMRVVIPPNVTAEIHVPGGSIEKVGSGEYTFRSSLAR